MCDYYWGEEYEKKMNEEEKAALREKGIENFDDALPDDGDTSGTFQNSARAMLFSGQYSAAALAMRDDPRAKCSNPRCGATTDLTLDHKTSVSKYFNQTGYLKTREERNRWYTNTGNLQVLCRSCNSSKSGERFDPQKVAQCILAGRN